MELSRIEINNYRNLDGMSVDINHDINFIVGENNIGKSNFQKCISNVFMSRQFQKEDFTDVSKELKVKIRLHISNEEIGIFDDLTDPSDDNHINICAIQSSADDYLVFSHVESGEPIKNSLIKRMNVITYDSLRNPKNEIDFSKTKGAGAFLNYLLVDYIEKTGVTDFVNKREIKKIVRSINAALQDIVAFERFNICPSVEEKNIEVISKIISLSDSNGVSIPENGYGVQYNLLIMLSLLEKIIDFCKNRNEEEDEFAALLVLDEPEIHLHPYLQRTIINDIQRISKGEDEKFNHLLNEYFGIPKMRAQIVITTHSPNILLNDYHKIVRMYRKGDTTIAQSCANLGLGESEEKQLIMQFAYIKEAVFSRAAIIVEGDSEYSSFGIFASKMGIDFDREGIALIKAGGAESILPIIAMLGKLGIKAVGVIDKDKKIEKNLPDWDNLFYTSSICYDSEIVKHLLKLNKSAVLERIICAFDANGLHKRFQVKGIEKAARKFGYKKISVSMECAISDYSSNEKMYELLCTTWFAKGKGILLGREIGNQLDVQDIPPCYRKAIKKVSEYANGN